MKRGDDFPIQGDRAARAGSEIIRARSEWRKKEGRPQAGHVPCGIREKIGKKINDADRLAADMRGDAVVREAIVDSSYATYWFLL